MRIGEKTHHLLSDYIKLMKKQSSTTSETFDIQQKADQLKQEISQIMKNDFEKSKNRDYEA